MPVARPAPIADHTEVPGAVGEPAPAPARHAEDEGPQPPGQRDADADGDTRDTTGKAVDPERHRQRLATEDGEALGERLQPGWRYADDDAQGATHLAHEPPGAQGAAPPDSDDLLDDSVDSIKGYRSKNERRRQVLGEIETDEQLHTAAAEPALTAQVWALRLNELMYSDSQARLRGGQLPCPARRACLHFARCSKKHLWLTPFTAVAFKHGNNFVHLRIVKILCLFRADFYAGATAQTALRHQCGIVGINHAHGAHAGAQAALRT